MVLLDDNDEILRPIDTDPTSLNAEFIFRTPTVQCRVINLNAALGQYLFQVAVGHAVSDEEKHSVQNNVLGKAPLNETMSLTSPTNQATGSIILVKFTTEPI